MPFGPVDAHLDLVELENRVLVGWKDDDVFAESVRRREGAPEWVFYEGPPTANGRPGIHHVWARLFKDIYPRFHTMRGKYVPRKAGWDCHGLPVEVEVEKELGFAGKPEIEEFGIEAFNQRCRESVQRYVEDWSALTGRIGMWLDMSDAYWTMNNSYIESVWWLFNQMWDAQQLYEGYKVVPVLRPVRDRALEPRAGSARRVPRRHRGLGLRPLPRHRARLRPARVDDDPLDAGLERRRGDRRRMSTTCASARRSPARATSSWPAPG